MDRWQAMKVFAKVAETGSFAETARLMHLSAPAVTRAVASTAKLLASSPDAWPGNALLEVEKTPSAFPL